VTVRTSEDTQTQILLAAEAMLRQRGYPKTSTRAVADAARVPLSQIHYHFGSRKGLMIAVLERQNAALIARQARAYASDAPLWQHWNRACDFYDEDLESGYVAVLQEMISAGWSDPELAAAVGELLQSWNHLLRDLATRAETTLGGFGPLSVDDVVALVAAAWLGSESLQLLGMEGHGVDTRRALRRVGEAIRQAEEAVTP
jgi:AcrR family transcriptional regulator